MNFNLYNRIEIVKNTIQTETINLQDMQYRRDAILDKLLAYDNQIDLTFAEEMDERNCMAENEKLEAEIEMLKARLDVLQYEMYALRILEEVESDGADDCKAYAISQIAMPDILD